MYSYNSVVLFLAATADSSIPLRDLRNQSGADLGGGSK